MNAAECAPMRVDIRFAFESWIIKLTAYDSDGAGNLEQGVSDVLDESLSVEKQLRLVSSQST